MEKIRPLVEEVDFKVHLFLKEMESEQFILSENLDDGFSSASLIKVPILVAVLDYIEQNKLSLYSELKIHSQNKVDFSVVTEQDLDECTLYELLVWMIITSDNSATNVLIDFIGMEKLNVYFNRIGLKATKLQRKMMDFERLQQGYDNVTNARDMAYLFTSIYEQTLLSEQYSNLVLDILSRQRVHEGLKRYISGDVQMAHKTGSLDSVFHDTGIVYLDSKDYIIGVFTTQLSDVEAGKRLIGRISKIAYEYFGSNERRSSI
ncbi:serine hydrolase [Ureibacillus manganicus]|uniref:serine hydrolase n=1 Tax=Ureibacillus manganicus TaxID=1266064 RepID=UPI000A5CC254|nr:serine hydrolase [Ureibacillus manganicus]